MVKQRESRTSTKKLLLCSVGLVGSGMLQTNGRRSPRRFSVGGRSADRTCSPRTRNRDGRMHDWKSLLLKDANEQGLRRSQDGERRKHKDFTAFAEGFFTNQATRVWARVTGLNLCSSFHKRGRPMPTQCNLTLRLTPAPNVSCSRRCFSLVPCFVIQPESPAVIILSHDNQISSRKQNRSPKPKSMPRGYRTSKS